MTQRFTWLEKFSNVMQYMTNKQQREYCHAMVLYGAFGQMPDFENLDPQVSGQIIGFMEDIEHSIKSIQNGKKGGRPHQT